MQLSSLEPRETLFLIITVGTGWISVTWWMIQRWITRQEGLHQRSSQRQEEVFERLAQKIDALTQQHASCMRQFADKEENRDSHSRIYARLELAETNIAKLMGKTEKQ